VILLPALVIAALVVFGVYVIAQHWQKTLRRQSWTIRRLGDRVRNLEVIADPMFLQRLNEAAPMPLEQVYTFSFRLDDRFWTDIVRATEEERAFIRQNGSFVGSVKIERWRSHTVATINEVLPDRKSTGWQTRSLDSYSDPAYSDDAFTLWELALSRPGLSAEPPPYVELVLRGNSIELCGRISSGAETVPGNGCHTTNDLHDVIFFHVPLDKAQLTRFRSSDPAEGTNGEEADGDGEQSVMFEPGASGNSWRGFYSDRDEALGLEWQLRLYDLTKRSEWERWRILESGVTPLVAEKK
jgi:hypothetical protein